MLAVIVATKKSQTLELQATLGCVVTIAVQALASLGQYLLHTLQSLCIGETKSSTGIPVFNR